MKKGKKALKKKSGRLVVGSDRNDRNRELDTLAAALERHYASKDTQDRYVSSMSGFMSALARKAFLKTGENHNGDLKFRFDPGAITAADIKAHLGISDQFADQILSYVDEQKGRTVGLEKLKFWVQPVFECIWADNEALKFITRELGAEREHEAAAAYEKIEESEDFCFPASFIDCAPSIIENLVSFCKNELC